MVTTLTDMITVDRARPVASLAAPVPAQGAWRDAATTTPCGTTGLATLMVPVTANSPAGAFAKHIGRPTRPLETRSTST